MIHIDMASVRDGLPLVSVFGALIRARRTAKKLSQEELGARVGKDQPYISEVERGTIKRPDDAVVKLLAWELEINEQEAFRALGVEVIVGEGIEIAVRGLVPADSVRFAAGEGATVTRVRVLEEDLRGARNPFGLEVRGDCLRSVGILSGDIVIVEPPDGRIPRDGELVVVRVGDEVSLKRWSMFRGMVELRDGEDLVVLRARPEDVEVVAFYVTYKPLAPR